LPLAAQISYPNQRSEAMCTIIEAHLARWEIEQARSLSSQINHAYWRNRVEQAIVKAQLKREMVEQAQTLTSQISDPDERNSTNDTIINKSSQRENWLETIVSIENLWLESRTYDELCNKFSLVNPLIDAFPEIALPLFESFDWVESALV
jgi:hypothetical protein